MVHELVFLRLLAGMQILAEVEMLDENMERQRYLVTYFVAYQAYCVWPLREQNLKDLG
jgi:hypothetical protein